MGTIAPGLEPARAIAPRRLLTAITALVIAYAALLSSLVGAAEKPPVAPKPPTSKPAAEVSEKKLEGPSRAPSLAEILDEVERIDALEREVRKRFGDGGPLKAAAAAVTVAEESFAAANTAVDKGAPGRVQVIALIDLANEVRNHVEKVQKIADGLGARVRAYDGDLDRIGGLNKDWTLLIAVARLRKAPTDLQQRLEGVPGRLLTLSAEVTTRRNANFAVLQRATRLLGRLNAMVDEADERRARLLESLRTVRAEPLWRAQPREDAKGYASAWVATELNQVRAYVAKNALTLGAIAVAAFALGYLLTVAARAKLASDPQQDAETEVARLLFRWPLLWALFIALTALAWGSPDAPVVYLGALLTSIAVLTVILVLSARTHKAVFSLYVLAAALVLNWFQVGLDTLPLSGRVALMVQCATVALVLGLDLYRGRIANEIALLPPRLMVRLIQGSIVLLMAAIVADVLGHLGLARLLRDGVLRMLGIGLVLNLVGRMLYCLILVSLRTQGAQLSQIVHHRAAAILSTGRVTLRGLAIAGWVAATLYSFRAMDSLDWVREGIAEAKIEVGTVTLSASAILLCVVIVVATVYTVRAAKMVLELELLPRLSLTSASAFVVSAATRYLLTVAGLILAMAALGIDFSKVTLLVSAVGVGIGFGLQNVVNNFVSGLLLLGERMINVGDTVQVGNLSGVVKRIGVRSSTVRTAQGAEVIVPNGDLTSKEVVNYTPADRRRRLDIVVRVASSNAPSRVVELLTEVAQNQPLVLAAPAPAVIFIGFGDSTLDFRLQAWIANYESSGAAETALRTAILARFEEERIEMPGPPQMVMPVVPAAPSSGPH